MALTLDGSSGIASVDGSAGSPSIRGSDSNSGVFFSSNVVRISTDGSEIGRFDDAGNFLANTTSIQAGVSDSSGGTQFCVNSTSGGFRLTQTDNTFWNCLNSHTYLIRFKRLGSYTGNIFSESNGTTTFNTGSDYRLKQNITAYTDGITKLKKLKPCEFEFKLEPGKVVDGFIAHEVAEAGLPWVIKGTKDAVDSEGELDPQSMDYGKLTPIITAALQEAITKIETLETKVAALEAA